MKLFGKGLIILNCNETKNYISYVDNNQLEEILYRVYVVQKISDIEIIDLDNKEIFFIDSDEDYEDLKEKINNDKSK